MWLTTLKMWFKREEGQDLTEYALIIALIVIGAVVAVGLLGTTIQDVLTSIADELTLAMGGT